MVSDITDSENNESSEEIESGSDQGEELRAGHTTWYQCDKCHRKERAIDCLYCKDFAG